MEYEKTTGRLEHFLHMEEFENVISVLLVMDCVIIILIIIFDGEYYHGKADDCKSHLKRCRLYGFLGCEPDGPNSVEFGDDRLYTTEKYLHYR
eukprot:UN02546